jgi:hypothetical protein
VVVTAVYHYANDYCLGCMQLLNQAKAMRQQVVATAAAAAQQVTEEGRVRLQIEVPSAAAAQ